MHSLFSWPKMLGTCALLAFTAGAVIQEMSPRSDLYQSTDENAAIDLGLSNISYASAQFNYRNYGSFGDINPRVNSSTKLQLTPSVNAPEIEMHIDSGCSLKVETTLDKEAIATINPFTMRCFRENQCTSYGIVRNFTYRRNWNWHVVFAASIDCFSDICGCWSIANGYSVSIDRLSQQH